MADGATWKYLRSAVRYAFCAALGLIVFAPVLFMISYPWITSRLEGDQSFHCVSGPSARSRISGWPTGLDPAEVEFVSLHLDGSRDSSSSWYRIVCTRVAAIRWARYMASQEIKYVQWLRNSQQEVESVRRIISGPPDERWKTGETPTWWVPPAIQFEATESMVWYKGHRSGVARSVYSSYDPVQRILWVYAYISQHDEMWTPGNPPAGEAITRLGQ